MVTRQWEAVDGGSGADGGGGRAHARAGARTGARVPQLPALTGLRFAAALGVVFYHFGAPVLPAGPLRASLWITYAKNSWISPVMTWMGCGWRRDRLGMIGRGTGGKAAHMVPRHCG